MVYNWVLIGNSESGTMVKMYYDKSNIRIDDPLGVGQYSIHVYLSSSLYNFIQSVI